MTKPEPKKCCPSCGGTNGYRFHLILRHIYEGQWGYWNSEECVNDEGLVSSSLLSCLDCGRQFQRRALKRKGFIA